MSRVRISMILVCVCFVGVTQAAWSQRANEAAKPGIPGYLDPKTGAFRPMMQAPAEEADAALVPANTTGKFVFNFTITIRSTNLGSDTIVCVVDASVFESTGLRVTESASVKATVSGTSATCTVTIPYSWPLTSASTDTVMLDYAVEAVGPSTTFGQPTRLSSQSLPSIKVPLSGATTTKPIASTI
jgi:hypothetical protein